MISSGTISNALRVNYHLVIQAGIKLNDKQNISEVCQVVKKIFEAKKIDLSCQINIFHDNFSRTNS